MKNHSSFLSCLPSRLLSFAATHNLDGRTLTVDELWAISAPGEKVAVTPEDWARIRLLTKPRSMLLPTVVIFTV